MNFPFAEKIGFSRNPLDYILVGNKLFPLKLWTVDRILVISLIFRKYLTVGILASRWKIFRRPIKARVKNTKQYSHAAITCSRQTHNAYYSPTDFIDSENYNSSLKEGMWKDIL